MSRTEQLADTAVDSAEVAWLVSKRAAAIRSRDAEYLASRYAPDAVTFGVAPPAAVPSAAKPSASSGSARGSTGCMGASTTACGTSP